MKIETERLFICPCDEKKLRRMADISAENKEIYLDAIAMSTGRELWELFTFWTAELKTDHTIVTELRLKGLYPNGELEIGYLTYEKHRGQGYASEAVAGVCSYLESIGKVKCFSALTKVDNVASQSVLVKNGFKYEKDMFGYMYWKR